MRANQEQHSVATLCRVLQVSESGHYAWSKRTLSQRAQQDATLSERIEAIHTRSTGTYGGPRVHAQLAVEGLHVSRRRVARRMRATGLQGASRRRWCTTVRDQRARPALDLVERDFTAHGPDKLWVAAITYVPTWAGFLYLAVVLDVWSRRIVGWAMTPHLRTERVLQALDMA